MSDNPDQSDEDRLEEALAILNALPREEVRQALLKAGATEAALDGLADLARSAQDPAIREDALRFLRDNHLEEVLIDEASPTTDDL